jgi:hypothetical protein
LANFISSNFGQLDEQPNTNRQGITVASTSVLSNNHDIYMPVPSERLVYSADRAGIETALGIDEMEVADRIPAGLIKMSNGASAVAYLDRKFVLGPESAHVNISGISGLATKTSYAMFLLQAILQMAADPEEIAVIILNVKHGDLLRVDERGPELPPDQKEMWEGLGLEPKPFKNVRYLLPRDSKGQPNSFVLPPIYTLYAYDLDSAADKLDLLFTNVSDPTNTMESIIGDIMQGLEGRGDRAFRNVQSWGIPVRRDNLVSAMYSTGLNSLTSLVTPQRTDRHGILDQKPPDFQLLSRARQGQYPPSRLSNRAFQEQRASPGEGDGRPRSPSRVVVLGKRRRAPVVHPPGGRGSLYVWPQARGGSGNDERVFHLPSP